ncbi:cupredoxin domain-containing protein [Candidatus Woesearchaeota archaeon]|nr:cupredoxin domain-containing protein [Candidatus Woesearchaeota archaeon]
MRQVKVLLSVLMILITKETGASTKEIVVKAYNFGFTPSVIKVKQGEEVTLKIVGVSGYHGISIPELGVSSEGITAGQETSVAFTADKKGSFKFRCNVYCGDGHRNMVGQLIVE